MSNIKSNVSFDQIPHIILNHPDTNAHHWAIMVRLYKILKDKHKCIYSNKKLAINTKLSLRTTERRISELVKMGFIICSGYGHNRRISLGLLFNNTAKISGKNLCNTAKIVEQPRHYGGHTKNYTNNKEERVNFTDKKPYNFNYQEYVGNLKSEIELGLKPKETKIMSLEEYELLT